MAYCRFSDDDYQCDVYCYEGKHGFIIDVAVRKVVLTEPLPPKVSFDDTEAWLARHNRVMDMLDLCERVPIGLPYDGERFEPGDASEAADILVMLREAGYRLPDYAIEELRKESAETEGENAKAQ